MPHSEFCIPHLSDTPAAAFAPLFDQPVPTPGGGLVMPPMDRSARTREASYQRLNYANARLELILVEWVDRLAVDGVAGFPSDLDRFERAAHILYRLTGIRKSINALEDNPTGSADVSSASPPDGQSPSPGNAAPGSADALVRNPANASPSATPSPNFPSPSIDIGQLTIDAPIDPSNPQSAIPNPQSPSVPAPSVAAVPVCPTLSPAALEAYLSRTEADLASLSTGSADVSSALANALQPAPPSPNRLSSSIDNGQLTIDASNPQSSSSRIQWVECPRGGYCEECPSFNTCHHCPRNSIRTYRANAADATTPSAADSHVHPPARARPA